MTELAEEKLKKYNQEHIIEQFNKLDAEDKEFVIKQILEINFEELNKIYESTKVIEQNKGKITPIDYIDKEKISEKQKIMQIGEQIIKNDNYAVITMAGGQGTRLGFNGPKGTYKLDIGPNGKYIFEILADNLKKSEKMYNILPYWYIMTSIQNNKQTIEFFEQNNYFGYDKNKVKFFPQGELPIVTKEGKLVIEDNKIKMGANGNGGVYEAIKKQGILEDFKNKNIKWVYICGVDNIMVNPIDSLFIGLAINNNMQIASKSVAKAYPTEKVGVFCKRDGKPSTVEYIELSQEMINSCYENGELIYGNANIVSHLLSVEALETVVNKDLKYHLAIKNGLYKFETFIFDGFEGFDDMLIMRVKREDEFAPIKNKEGIDSPETAKKIYEEYKRKTIM